MTASGHLQYVVGLSVDRSHLMLGMLLTCLAAAAICRKRAHGTQYIQYSCFDILHLTTTFRSEPRAMPHGVKYLENLGCWS